VCASVALHASIESLHILQSLPAQLNGLVRAICSICRTELAHDVRLLLLKSRRGAAAGASASAERARSGLRGSMKKDSKKGVTYEFKAPAPD
jgi:hypothetical protein